MQLYSVQSYLIILSMIVYHRKVRPIKVKGKEWVKDQEATFLHWINQHLKSAQRSIQVTDLYNDLRNGLVLIELMKVLTPTSIKYVK